MSKDEEGQKDPHKTTAEEIGGFFDAANGEKKNNEESGEGPQAEDCVKKLKEIFAWKFEFGDKSDVKAVFDDQTRVVRLDYCGDSSYLRSQKYQDLISSQSKKMQERTQYEKNSDQWNRCDKELKDLEDGILTFELPHKSTRSTVLGSLKNTLDTYFLKPNKEANQYPYHYVGDRQFTTQISFNVDDIKEDKRVELPLLRYYFNINRLSEVVDGVVKNLIVALMDLPIQKKPVTQEEINKHKKLFDDCCAQKNYEKFNVRNEEYYYKIPLLQRGGFPPLAMFLDPSDGEMSMGIGSNGGMAPGGLMEKIISGVEQTVKNHPDLQRYFYSLRGGIQIENTREIDTHFEFLYLTKDLMDKIKAGQQESKDGGDEARRSAEIKSHQGAVQPDPQRTTSQVPPIEIEILKKETPHMFMWFTNGSRVPEGKSVLPQTEQLNYVKRLTEECAKLNNTNTPVYLVYMGRMLNDQQKEQIKSLKTQDTPNLFVIDYDDVEMRLAGEGVSEIGRKVATEVAQYVEKNAVGMVEGGIAPIVDFTRLVLLHNSDIVTQIARDQYNLSGAQNVPSWVPGIVYRDFDVTLSRPSMRDLPCPHGFLTSLNFKQVVKDRYGGRCKSNFLENYG